LAVVTSAASSSGLIMLGITRAVFLTLSTRASGGAGLIANRVLKEHIEQKYLAEDKSLRKG